MAKQAGILGITGTVGGITFDKNGNVRQARASNKAQFEGAESMARTRENAGEFGRAAISGKLLRQALRKQIRGAADALMVSRLTKVMREMTGLDTTHPRGKREVLKAHLHPLVGFDFNLDAPLPTVFAATYTVAVSGAGVVTVTLPALIPLVDLLAPVGATHYGLEMGVAVLDFGTNTARAVVVTGLPAPAALDAATVPSVALTAALGAAPTATEGVVVVLGVNFFQQINTQLYPLNNGATNPLGVVYAA